MNSLFFLLGMFFMPTILLSFLLILGFDRKIRLCFDLIRSKKHLLLIDDKHSSDNMTIGETRTYIDMLNKNIDDTIVLHDQEEAVKTTKDLINP